MCYLAKAGKRVLYENKTLLAQAAILKMASITKSVDFVLIIDIWAL